MTIYSEETTGLNLPANGYRKKIRRNPIANHLPSSERATVDRSYDMRSDGGSVRDREVLRLFHRCAHGWGTSSIPTTVSVQSQLYSPLVGVALSQLFHESPAEFRCDHPCSTFACIHASTLLSLIPPFL